MHAECSKHIDNCFDFGSFYSLSDELESIGLVLRETHSGKVALCRVEDGKPVFAKMVDDFIFVGSYTNKSNPIPGALKECILEFVKTKASDAKLVVDEKSWQRGANAVGPTLFVQDEDVKHIMQSMALEERLGGASLLDAVKDWLEDAKI